MIKCKYFMNLDELQPPGISKSYDKTYGSLAENDQEVQKPKDIKGVLNVGKNRSASIDVKGMLESKKFYTIFSVFRQRPAETVQRFR